MFPLIHATWRRKFPHQSGEGAQKPVGQNPWRALLRVFLVLSSQRPAGAPPRQREGGPGGRPSRPRLTVPAEKPVSFFEGELAKGRIPPGLARQVRQVLAQMCLRLEPLQSLRKSASSECGHTFNKDSWLLGLCFLFRLRRGDFLPRRRAPRLPRHADEDCVPISAPCSK